MTSAETTEPQSDFVYLKYATFGQILEVCRSAFWLWLFLSAAGLIIRFVMLQATTAVVDGTGLGAVPNRYWLLGAVPILSWVLRGKTFTIPIPKLTFAGWLLFNLFCLLFGLVILVVDSLPWWVAPPSYFAMLSGFLSYIGLVEMGKANCAKGENP